MDERLRFVARLLEGEKMAPLCAEPDDVRAVQHGVEHHQPLDGTRKGGLGGSAGRPASRSAQ